MENINIAELLKDAPKGMELYSPVCGKCNFNYVQFADSIIKVSNKTGVYSFAKDGTYTRAIDAECLLFPSKDNRDWSTFQKPFKDGDILISGLDGCQYNPFIFKQLNSFGNAECYCAINCYGELIFNSDNWTRITGCRVATPEEKQRLFDVIIKNGYKWNEKTKTLDKLVEPEFKIGNKVRHKTNHNVVFTIDGIEEDFYTCDTKMAFSFNEQDNYELVPNKFDITILIPFESKVLVRDNIDEVWLPCFFGGICNDNNNYQYRIVGGERWKCCIPYEGNEHLLGKKDDCSEYYKNW